MEKLRIFLERRNCIPAYTGNKKTDRRLVATMIRNIQSLGFTFSKEALEQLSTYGDSKLHELYDDIVPVLQKMVGAHKKYEPMYPNFQKQVMEADEAELYLNAMMHYFGDWAGVRIMPKYEKEERKFFNEKVEYTVIGTTEDYELHDIFRNIMRSKTAISKEDKDDLGWYLDNCEYDLPAEIPHKEVLAFVANRIMEGRNPIELVIYFKSATDILRLAVAMSDGDVSLAENTRFRSFKRKERRFLLRMLDYIKNAEEDMARYRRQENSAGVLHP